MIRVKLPFAVVVEQRAGSTRVGDAGGVVAGVILKAGYDGQIERLVVSSFFSDLQQIAARVMRSLGDHPATVDNAGFQVRVMSDEGTILS